ncbi:MAG: hypothetical protein Q4C96_00365 [Planctomycetia bacterium]|nr:hypothetical protein [Planctomycetia bacterium]
MPFSFLESDLFFNVTASAQDISFPRNNLEENERKESKEPGIFSPYVQNGNDAKNKGAGVSRAVFPPVPLTPSSQEGIPLYLMNKDGRLVVVPGIRLEQLEQMIHVNGGERPEKSLKPSAFPEYIIHSIQGTGQIEKNFVKLKVFFRVETFMDTPIKVPLRFNESILCSMKQEPESAQNLEEQNVFRMVQTPKMEKDSEITQNEQEKKSVSFLQRDLRLVHSYQGEGRMWLEFQQENGGFIAWIMGKGIHEMELHFLLPVQRSGEENFLSLECPAATMSELKFELPQTRGESEMMNVSVSEGATLLSPLFVVLDSQENPNIARNDERGITQLNVMQVKDTLRLAWSIPEKKRELPRTVREVDGLILTTIEKSEIKFTAQLKVNIHGLPTNQIFVRLPSEAEWIPTFSPNYIMRVHQEVQPENISSTKENPESTTYVSSSVKKNHLNQEEVTSPLEKEMHIPGIQTDSMENKKDRVLVEVLLKEKITGTVNVTIQARISKEMMSCDDWFDLGGFEVLDASRQTGHYAIKSELNRHNLWAPGDGVRRVESLPEGTVTENFEPSSSDVLHDEETSESGESSGRMLKPSSSTETLPENGFREESLSPFSPSEQMESGTGGESDISFFPPLRSADDSSFIWKTHGYLTALHMPAENGEEEIKNELPPRERKGGTEGADIIFMEGSSDSVMPKSVTDSSGHPVPENLSVTSDGISGEISPRVLQEKKEWVAVFEYTSQPMRLLTRLITRSVRLNVEPEYHVTVTDKEIQLKGTWKCFIRGGRISWIDVDFGDWNFDFVGPENLIFLESLEVDAKGRISVPLIQPTSGHFVLTFQAHRKLSENESEVEFTFPQVVQNQAVSVIQTATPAEVCVQPAVNIELVPNMEKISSMTRLPKISGSQKKTSPVNAFYYRCENARAVFAATRKIHTQAISVRQLSRLEVYPERYHVYQTYEYKVSYVPIQQLKFILPEINTEMMDVYISHQEFPNGDVPSGAGEREFYISGEHGILEYDVSHQNGGTGSSFLTDNFYRSPYVPVFTTRRPVVRIAPLSGGDLQKRQMDVTVQLPEEKIGIFYVTFSYTVSSEKLSAAVSHLRDYFLGVSQDGTLQENRLRVYAHPSIQVMPLPVTSESTQWKEYQLMSEANRFSEVVIRAVQDGLDYVQLGILSPRTGSVGSEKTVSESGIPGEFNIRPKESLSVQGEVSGGEVSSEDKARSAQDISLSSVKRVSRIPFLLECRSSSAQERIILAVELREKDPQSLTIIDRYWLQSWIAGNIRQDRAAFLFQPVVTENTFSGGGEEYNDGTENNYIPSRRFTVQLPTGASVDEAEVWINHRPGRMGTDVKRLSANSLQITLQSVPDNLPCTVEVRYQFPCNLQTEEKIRMEVPYVEDAAWIRGMYWQVVVPGNVHIISPPEGFSMEYRWAWNRFFWGRVPLWEQASLERWSGAFQGTPAPGTMNRYVFAGMGARDTLKNGVSVFVVNRTTLVSLLAVVVFLCGFIFIHFSCVRHPLFLLALLIILGGFGLRYPDLTLLALQAASLGAVLVVISVLCNFYNRGPFRSGGEIVVEAETTISPSQKTIITPITEDVSPSAAGMQSQRLSPSDKEVERPG